MARAPKRLIVKGDWAYAPLRRVVKARRGVRRRNPKTRGNFGLGWLWGVRRRRSS